MLPAVLIRSSLIAAKRGLFNEEEGGAPSAAGALAGLTSSAAAKEVAARTPFLQLGVTKMARRAGIGKEDAMDFSHVSVAIVEFDLQVEEEMIRALALFARQLRFADLATAPTTPAAGGFEAAGQLDSPALRAAYPSSPSGKRRHTVATSSPSRRRTLSMDGALPGGVLAAGREGSFTKKKTRRLSEDSIDAPARVSSMTPRGSAAAEPSDRGRPGQLETRASTIAISSAETAAMARAEAAKPSLWYFRKLNLSAVKVNVTYLHASSGGLDVIGLIEGQGIMQLIPNLDRAPLRLDALQLANTFASPEQLQERILLNYKAALLRQVYQLALHVELLANPAGLVRGLGAGLKDFVFLPTKGLLKSPEEFGRGLINGTWSLARAGFGGTAKTAGHLAGALGTGLATLSMDSEYLKYRKDQEAPQHVLDGLMKGGVGLGRGVVEGLTGIISAPIEGAQREGGVGFLKGMGEGAGGGDRQAGGGRLRPRLRPHAGDRQHLRVHRGRVGRRRARAPASDADTAPSTRCTCTRAPRRPPSA